MLGALLASLCSIEAMYFHSNKSNWLKFTLGVLGSMASYPLLCSFVGTGCLASSTDSLAGRRGQRHGEQSVTPTAAADLAISPLRLQASMSVYGQHRRAQIGVNPDQLQDHRRKCRSAKSQKPKMPNPSRGQRSGSPRRGLAANHGFSKPPSAALGLLLKWGTCILLLDSIKFSPVSPESRADQEPLI